MKRMHLLAALAGAFAAASACGADGFWRVRQDPDGRWWAVDPQGRDTFLSGVDHVSWIGHPCEKTGTRRYLETNRRKYGTREKWAQATGARLRGWGFNFLGAGCDPALRTDGRAYAVYLDFSSQVTRGAGARAIRPNPRNNPCEGFPDVFDPAWEAACRRVARERCAPLKDDPSLFGWFIDNELAWWGRDADFSSATGLFDCAAALPPETSARRAIDAFLKSRGVRAASSADKAGFLRLAAERYFSVAASAIRAADPNHLVLGCRFAGFSGANRVVWEEAGRQCDIVTFNNYPWADLDRNVLCAGPGARDLLFADVAAERAAWTGRPLMVSEWSFPAIDAGMPCLHGAGQRMNTQSERARATALCLRTFLSSPALVGHSYFMWVDEPALGISAELPEDSNYGLVSEDDEPYPLVKAFARIGGDFAKWRRLPPPAPRPLPPPSGVELASGAFAAEGYRGPDGGVSFSREGDGYRLCNRAGFSLGGRVGGRLMFDSVTLGGAEIGSYGAMLHYSVAGRLRWEDATRTESVAWDGASGRLRVRATDGRAFAVTHAFTLHPDRPLMLVECESLKNVGAETLDVRAVYFRQHAPYAGEAKPPRRAHPDLWKAPRADGWMAADGRFWGAETRARGVFAFVYYTAADGAHPDAAIAPEGGAFRLAPGGAWRPSEGTAWILCRARKAAQTTCMD